MLPNNLPRAEETKDKNIDDTKQKQIIVPTPNFSLPNISASLLLTVPSDIWNLLFLYYLNDTASRFTFYRTGKFFKLFTMDISQLEDHPLRRLLSYGALGELEQAEPYYKNDKSILTCYGTVYHPNRFYNDKTNQSTFVDIPPEMSFSRPKYVKVTYLQILMMNDEWQEATEVAKHMSMDDVAEQFFEVFPDGKIIKYDHDGKEWDFEKAKELLKV